jgi:adenosylmethionine-8-amino-7-oxononanoate aminotransferase
VAARVRDACLEAGVVTYPGTGMADGTRGDIISLYPPLTFTQENIDDMTQRLVAGLTAVGSAIGRGVPSALGDGPRS